MVEIEVPEIHQLPELSGEENPAAFANMVLTATLGYGNVRLHSEYRPEGVEWVSWLLHPRESGHEIEIACSHSLESFRAALSYIGQTYMGGIAGNGYAKQVLKQRGKTHICHFYLANSSNTGFWLRVCVEA